MDTTVRIEILLFVKLLGSLSIPMVEPFETDSCTGPGALENRDIFKYSMVS
jgi:hypothetical protein